MINDYIDGDVWRPAHDGAAHYTHLIGGFKVSLLKFSHLFQQLPIRVEMSKELVAEQSKKKKTEKGKWKKKLLIFNEQCRHILGINKTFAKIQKMESKCQYFFDQHWSLICPFPT